MSKMLLFVAVAMAGTLTGMARSITDATLNGAGDAAVVTVAFDAGAAGDNHALYVAYAAEDKGANLAGWTTFQRVGIVAADATSASFAPLPGALRAGLTTCRAFLVDSVYPFDTLVDSLRQTGTQYVETGVTPGPATCAAIDFCIDSNATRQQRLFGVASDDGTSLFSFDAYVQGAGYWASACQDGKGDWTASSLSAVSARTTVSLDAATGLHFVSNHASHATASVSHAKKSRTATAAGALTLFARRTFINGADSITGVVTGGNIYSCVISNEGACVRSYLPCTLNGRAGLYDGVSGTIFWSAVADDDFTAAGGSVPCAPAAGEAQVAASSAFDLGGALAGSVWTGAASGNWNAADANWTVGGASGQAWTDGGDAFFYDSAAARDVTIPSGVTVTPASATFQHDRDYTLAGAGGIAGTGTFTKAGDGTLTIAGINNSFTGDMLLAGGTTVLTGDKDSADITSGALGNPRVARTVTVSNATLRIRGKNAFGGSGRSSTPIRAALKFVNGTLDLPTNFTFNAGDLYLHDSSVVFNNGLTLGTHWGSLAAENIYFSGASAVTFAPADDVGDAALGKIGLLLGKFAQATLDVPDITANSSVDVSIRMPILWASGNGSDPGIASGFRKTGAGTLQLAASDDICAGSKSTYTGDVDVVEGALMLSSGGVSFSANHASAFGQSGIPHTFTVHPGATLQLAANDLQGQFYATNAITLHVNGGTLTQDAGLVNGLGRLVLENATLSYSGANVVTAYYGVSADGTETNQIPYAWPTIGFNGGVEFRGTNVYTLANGNVDGVHSRLFFGTVDGNPSDCYVEEISGKGTVDDTADVTVNARLEDAPPWYKYAGVDGRRIVTGFNFGLSGLALNMRKTGPGMLQLNSKLSTTTGRIEVAEGTLRIGGGMGNAEANFECPTNTYLGDLRDPNRTALVLNGGTLWLTGNDTFGQANTVNGSTFAVTNGTIRQTAGKVNALPALDLYDATFNYSGASTGSGSDIAASSPWGTFIFSQRVRFDGTRPYDLQNAGGTCYFSLGWQSDSYTVPSGNYTEQHGKTEFYVADITTNADPDVTIGVVLKFPARWNGNATNSKYSKTNFRTGLLKTGPGTLRLNCGTAAEKYYAEATRVNGGTLLVDAQTFNSTNVFVQAGAYLGGTGTVARATIEAGGGFTAAPGQARPLTLAAAELPADGVVTLDVPYTGDVANLESVSVPVVTASALAGAKWRVTLNGAAVPSGYVGSARVRDGVVWGVVGRGGTCVIFR